MFVLISTDKCSPHTLSLKQTETIIEKQNQPTCRVVENCPSGYIYETTSTSKAKGTLQKKGQKGGKSQKITEFTVRLCL